MKVTNISKALQGVNAKSGRVFIRPGEAKEVEFDEVGLKQARRLKSILDLGTAKEDHPAPAAVVKTVHHGGGKFNVVDGDQVLLSGLSKAAADTFNKMSAEDKKAYIDAAKA